MLTAIRDLAQKSKESGLAVAFGEIGLDYDRLFLAPKDQQIKYFEAQLEIAVELQLPLFLHTRACAEDFERLLFAKLDQLPKRGLVHSFTGTVEEMQRLVEKGFDIGVNGCSSRSNILVGPRICAHLIYSENRRKRRSCEGHPLRTAPNRNRRPVV